MEQNIFEKQRDLNDRLKLRRKEKLRPLMSNTEWTRM